MNNRWGREPGKQPGQTASLARRTVKTFGAQTRFDSGSPSVTSVPPLHPPRSSRDGQENNKRRDVILSMSRMAVSIYTPTQPKKLQWGRAMLMMPCSQIHAGHLQELGCHMCALAVHEKVTMGSSATASLASLSESLARPNEPDLRQGGGHYLGTAGTAW